jgi:SAM-dependent methyltransferase
MIEAQGPVKRYAGCSAGPSARLHGGVSGAPMADSCDEHPHNLSTFYADPELLLARQSSQAAGTAAEDFAGWVLALLGGVSGLEVLDAGAGVGRFTTRLTRLADPSGTVVALDLFGSMLETVRSRARPTPRLGLVNGDIDHLPFRENTFDLVFANHVLYHLRDIARGLDELARVLRPSGRFVATTNAGDAHVPVIRLHDEIAVRTGFASATDASSFSLENGAAILATHFDHVETRVFTSSTRYGSTQALVDAYATTGRYRLIAEALGQAAVLDLASAVASEWLDSCPDGLWGEVRMAAFVCTAARTTSAPLP